MNLKQAQYIKTISQTGSLTAAAKKLYVSQPSLSQMLRQIEEDIGLPLFDRSVSPFRITYAGEKFLEAADAIIAANTQLESQLREIRNDHSGNLRLGISVTRAMQVIPLVMPAFIEEYPDIRLELTECGSAGLEDLLVKGEIDLAMAAIETDSTSMAYELIEKETIGILAGRDSSIAKRTISGNYVSICDVASERFVCLSKSHSSRVIQDKLFRKHGISPRVLLETDSLEVAKRVCVDTGACMILPNIYIDEYVRQKRGEFFPLADYENHRHFYACYRKDEFLPRYTKDFIRITTRMLAKECERAKAFRI